MKSTHHVQQRSKNQDERLRAFGDPAFCRIYRRERKLKSSGANCYDLGSQLARNIGSRTQRVRDTCSCQGCGEIVVVFRDRDIGEGAMNSVEDLDVFKLAHQLTLKTYSATKAFPREQLFSLGDQTRRVYRSF